MFDYNGSETGFENQYVFYTESKSDSRNPETCYEEVFPGFKMAEKEHVANVTNVTGMESQSYVQSDFFLRK